MADPSADAARWADALLARDVVAALPARERRALALVFVAEWPLSRVGADLGLSPRAARRLVGRALRHARRVAQGVAA